MLLEKNQRNQFHHQNQPKQAGIQQLMLLRNQEMKLNVTQPNVVPTVSLLIEHAAMLEMMLLNQAKCQHTHSQYHLKKKKRKLLLKRNLRKKRRRALMLVLQGQPNKDGIHKQMRLRNQVTLLDVTQQNAVHIVLLLIEHAAMEEMLFLNLT